MNPTNKGVQNTLPNLSTILNNVDVNSIINELYKSIIATNKAIVNCFTALFELNGNEKIEYIKRQLGEINVAHALLYFRIIILSLSVIDTIVQAYNYLKATILYLHLFCG